MKHETTAAAEPLNLFDVEPASVSVEPKPRQATGPELHAYAAFLVASRGLKAFAASELVSRGCNMRRDYRVLGVTCGARRDGGEYETGAYSIPFPGGSARETVTLERLGDDGEVLSASTLPTDGKRAVPWKKDAIAKAVGPVEKVKRAARTRPAMSDSETMRLYCEQRAAELAEEQKTVEAVADIARAVVALPAGAVVHVDFAAHHAAREAAVAAQEQLGGTPQPADVVDALSDDPDGPAADPEPVGAVDAIAAMLGAIMDRLDRLEARTPPAVESERLAAERPRRTAARERMIRRYLAMRAERARLSARIGQLAAAKRRLASRGAEMRGRADLDRRALLAAGEHVRAVAAERDTARAAVENAAGDAQRKARDAIGRAGALEKRLEEMQGRAIRAEQALQLYRVTGVPVSFGGMTPARLSYGAAR